MNAKLSPKMERVMRALAAGSSGADLCTTSTWAALVTRKMVAPTPGRGSLEFMHTLTDAGRAWLAAKDGVVSVTPIDATPVQALALLADVAAKAYAAQGPIEPKIEAGQSYRETDSGDVIAITRVTESFVYAGERRAYLREEFAEGVAAGRLTLVGGYVPQIGDRVTITGDGAWRNRTGTVDKASDYSDALRVKFDNPTHDGRKAGWVVPRRLAKLDAPAA